MKEEEEKRCNLQNVFHEDQGSHEEKINAIH